jgi:3-hydroxyisobutyrate dehydrogenase
MRVGFVGLGHMGENMAARVLAGGHDVAVHDLDRSRSAGLMAAGATWSDHPAACAAGAEIVITSLPGPSQCEQVVRGSNGVLSGIGRGAIWVDMTTNRGQLVCKLASEMKARGAATLEAPVTGAVDGARKGKLTIFVGGESDVLAHANPVLETMGRVIVCGPLGTGNVTKLVTNLLWFTHATALGEALVLGKKAGVELGVLWEAIKSSVADSFVARHDAPSIFAGHYDPSFSLDLCVKDLALIMEIAKSANVPIELGQLVKDRFERARQEFGGASAELLVVKLLEDEAGTDLRLAGSWPKHWEA